MEGASSLVFLVLMGAMFYFLLIRPQKRRVQQHQALVASLEVGDEIVTIGGLYGTIVSLSDDDLRLQVDQTTTVRLLKSAVARVVVEEPAPQDDAAEEEQQT